MKANIWLVGGLLAAAGLSNPAWAALAVNPVPNGTLTFVTPVGNVGPTDSIPVMLTLTLTDDSAPLTPLSFDDYEKFADELPDGFMASSAYLTYSFTHGGTLSTDGIKGPPYSFSFTEGQPLGSETLQPGESLIFEFGSYAPSNGPVATGTYFGSELSVMAVFTDDTQPDPYGGPGAANGWDIYLTIASTCDDCFQRTVVTAVPEPETYAMLLTGLGMIGWVARRRKRA